MVLIDINPIVLYTARMERREGLVVPHEMREIRGQLDGPTSIVLVGTHGWEMSGVHAADRVFTADLTLARGRVLFGYGNPRAVLAGVRGTEADLNRMFKPDEDLTDEQKRSYEYERAQELKVYLRQSDVLLDVHDTKNPQGIPFIICEPNGYAVARYLPADKIVSGFDEIEPGGTDYWMNQNGKIGICIECGPREEATTIDRAEDAMRKFLGAQEHIDMELTTREGQERSRLFMIYITNINFTRTKPYADFEPIAKGQIIGTDGGENVVAEQNAIILFAHSDSTKPGEDPFLLAVKETGQQEPDFREV